ncbi:hypothetical protein [Salinisphaera hydrothermalis]|uniref:hypothetical protein n=1 Tax=Salinisphaera hydrothermalis TaxID=563188 RepID=UPI003342121D
MNRRGIRAAMIGPLLWLALSTAAVALGLVVAAGNDPCQPRSSPVTGTGLITP